MADTLTARRQRAPAPATRQATAAGAILARSHAGYPSFRHWFLETMGVDPAAQRKGLGRQLLEPVREIAARDRVDCYLQTADRANVHFYKRHGLVVENRSLQPRLDGPAHVAMRRRPVQ